MSKTCVNCVTNFKMPKIYPNSLGHDKMNLDVCVQDETNLSWFKDSNPVKNIFIKFYYYINAALHWEKTNIHIFSSLISSKLFFGLVPALNAKLEGWVSSFLAACPSLVGAAAFFPEGTSLARLAICHVKFSGLG